ncbi:WD40 repeat domain-containing protein [Micromonospora fluostatini]|uniref:hypothetical protein n=1 Tax=Micromonospora sp. JCM 30529 TaxID=3421643 RepID=UPI003D16DF78
MRRVVSLFTVAVALFGATVAFPGAATAAPAPQTEAEPGKKRCTVADERLRELSGLVATENGYIVVNDSSDVEERKRVFYLDSRCRVTKVVQYTQQGPFDTEDLALSPDGQTLWIADIGDNITSRERRQRVAVWTMPVDGSERPVLHRLSYPERKPHDAEALLIGPDNLPLVITKELNGKSQIFTPTGPLKSGDTDPVPMKKVGEVTLPKTTTDNRLGAPGRLAVTGAARSPDGTRVVLRTYADAFEYDVTDGDVLGALTTGTPRVTPLADPFGEAISYTPDGRTFVTVSDGGQLEDSDPIDILAYTPSQKTAAELAAGPEPPPAKEQSFLSGLSLDDITYLIAAIGILGALLVGAGIVGILRSRRRPQDDPEERRPDDGPTPDDAGRTGPARDGDRARGGVYGGGAAAPGVYGAPAAARAEGAPGPGGRAGKAGPGGARGGKAAPVGGGVYGGGGQPARGGGVYGGGRPPAGGGGGYAGAPAGPEGPRGGPGGGRGGPGGPPGGRDADFGGDRGGPPPGNGRGGRGGPPPAGGRGGHSGGGGRGGTYGGGRAEPPRRGSREPEPREPRAGRRREPGPDDGRGGQYGQPYGGRGDYRGERY